MEQIGSGGGWRAGLLKARAKGTAEGKTGGLLRFGRGGRSPFDRPDSGVVARQKSKKGREYWLISVWLGSAILRSWSRGGRARTEWGGLAGDFAIFLSPICWGLAGVWKTAQRFRQSKLPGADGHSLGPHPRPGPAGETPGRKRKKAEPLEETGSCRFSPKPAGRMHFTRHHFVRDQRGNAFVAGS